MQPELSASGLKGNGLIVSVAPKDLSDPALTSSPLAEQPGSRTLHTYFLLFPEHALLFPASELLPVLFALPQTPFTIFLLVISIAKPSSKPQRGSQPLLLQTSIIGPTLCYNYLCICLPHYTELLEGRILIYFISLVSGTRLRSFLRI